MQQMDQEVIVFVKRHQWVFVASVSVGKLIAYFEREAAGKLAPHDAARSCRNAHAYRESHLPALSCVRLFANTGCRNTHTRLALQSVEGDSHHVYSVLEHICKRFSALTLTVAHDSVPLITSRIASVEVKS